MSEKIMVNFQPESVATFSGIYKKLARINSSGDKEYFHNDYLGSVRLMTNGSAWNRDYYPFGSDKDASGSGNDYKWTGNIHENGFYSFVYRNLYSDVGRWNKVDPSWVIRPGISPYSYCNNNPLRWVDLLGMDWIPHDRDGDGYADYWEWDEGILVYPSDDTFKGFGAWLGRKFPLATENDSWFYKFWRGTGDINKDLVSFSLGVTAAPVIAATAVYGGVVYGPTVVALMTKYGAILSSMGLTTQQKVHVWVTTVGADKAGRFLQSVHNIGRGLGQFYYANKYTIDSFFYGIGDAFTPSYLTKSTKR